MWFGTGNDWPRMARIDQRLHDVRAWNGVPGVNVHQSYGSELKQAGLPVGESKRVGKSYHWKDDPARSDTAWVVVQIENSGDFIDDDAGDEDDLYVPAASGDEDVSDYVPSRFGLEREKQLKDIVEDLHTIIDYRVHPVLAALEPDADLAVWAWNELGPQALDAAYRLQSSAQSGAFRDYLRDLRREAER